MSGTRQHWTEQAERWVAQADLTAAATRPASEALLRALAPSAGQRLLDVAAGAGDPALLLAAAVGPTGSVTATDAVVAMLDGLRERARQLGLENLRAVHAAAEELDLEPGSFDGACCRFGVMFFDDPLRGLSRMARAVRAGGTLAVMAWGAPQANPFFTCAAGVLDELGVPAPETGPDTRTVFECAEPGRLLALAREASWRSPREQAVDFPMTLPDTTPATLLERQASLSVALGQRCEGLDAATREQARALVETRAAPFAADGAVAFPAQALLVTGLA